MIFPLDEDCPAAMVDLCNILHMNYGELPFNVERAGDNAD